MQPNEGNIDPLLTNLAKGYQNDAFIADLLMPRLTVPNKTGNYYVWGKEAFRIENDLVAPTGRANRVENSMSIATYGPLIEHQLEQAITKDEKRILGEDKARESATNNVVTKIKLNHEKTVADKWADTSIITQNLTLSGTDQFSDFSGSDPVGRVAAAVDIIHATGIMNLTDFKIVVSMGHQVWSKLKLHTGLKAMLSTASMRTPLTKADLAALFDVDEVIVGSARYDSAKEGQTANIGNYVWGKHLWVSVVPRNPAMNTVAPGYTLELEPNNESRVVERWTEVANNNIELVRYTDNYEPKFVATEAVFVYKNAVA